MFKTKLDEVADIIRERIISGQYARGTKLKQSDIAVELGVSITPVREALHVLEAEGYVRGASHKGLTVPDLDLDSVQETFDLRLALERELTARALPRLERAHIAELRQHQALLAAAARGDDPMSGRIENYRFHFRLYELAERPQTLQFVRVLWSKFPFLAHEQPERRAQQVAEHERFLVHAEAGEHDRAVEAMVAHIRGGWDHFARTMQPGRAGGASA